MEPTDPILAEQIAYYRARAPEYDEWFERRGRYDRGSEHTERWNGEVELVREAARSATLVGSILELACGTGWWTSELTRTASHVLALDASPQAIELNRRRVRSNDVRYLQANVFEYPTLGVFDVVFFSFWLSHVPPAHFEPFWNWLGRCLKPGGRVFFIDNLWYPGYRWPGERPARLDETLPGYVAGRELNDGRRFNIVKVFYEPDELTTRLSRHGWSATVSATPEFFIWGEVHKEARVEAGPERT